MKQLKKVLGMAFIITGMFAWTITVSANQVKGYSMYRVYNPNSGEHFYTKDIGEQKYLKQLGWKDEGVGWYAPSTGDPVYRLYNKNAGDHHYTLNKQERDYLVKVGWKFEGIGWYSEKATGIKLYRAYNPNAKAGSHNYTTSTGEQAMLIKVGWKNEGIAWYGLQSKKPFITGIKNVTITQYLESFDLNKDVKATDFLGNDVKVTVTGSVDTKKAGSYTLTYTATDTFGNVSTETRIVTVNKVKSPTITGVKDVTINKSTGVFDFDKGISAKDASNKSLSTTMQTELIKENPKSGTYTVTYIATDEFGNTASQKQTVTIVNDVKPVFTGIENTRVNIIEGSFDSKYGVQALDGDGNVLMFDVTGTVDFTKAGNNELVYHAKDNEGNETTVTRNVEVVVVPVKYINIINGTSEMHTTEKIHLEVSVYPTEASNKNLTWVSSNPSVATVDQDGNVQAIKQGKTVIIVTADNGVNLHIPVVVSDDIDLIVDGKGAASDNNINFKLVGFSILNKDTRSVTIKRVEVISGLSNPVVYTEQDYKNNGWKTVAYTNESLDIIATSALGFKKGNTELRAIIEASNGTQVMISQIF